MKIQCLVTGGAGFVGTHLVNKLVTNDNLSVTVIDDFSTGNPKNLEETNCIIKEKDITQLSESDNINKYRVIFHLAAKPFSKTKKDWLTESQKIFQTNVYGTYNLLRLSNPNCHFIAMSSASIYGEGVNLHEELPYNPKSAYGYSKVLTEQVIIHSPRPYTIVRPGTIIGALGRCFPNRLIWTAINNQPCKLFDNGNITRDIIDARDVATALEGLMETKTYGIYNLGSNTTTTGNQLNEFLQKIKTQFNINPKITKTPKTPIDFVKISTLNSNKLYTALHWQPKHNIQSSFLNIINYYLNSETTLQPPSWESL